MAEETVGAIGGSRLYEIEGLAEVEEVAVNTPFGRPSDVIVVREVSAVFEGWEAFGQFQRDRTLVLEPETGVVALARRIASRDETGRCTTRDREVLNDRVWAKKEFVIPDPNVRRATLAARLDCEVSRDALSEHFTYRDTDPRPATLVILVNGHPIEFPWPKERPYWGMTHCAIDIPSGYLKAGLNEFVFHSADTCEWYLLIEDSLHPNRSARSADGGQTWDYDHLGPTGGHDGEYLMRLELDGHPPEGTLTSPPLDLATLFSSCKIGKPSTLKALNLHAQVNTPAGTVVEFGLRGGPTPAYDPLRWTAWCPLAATGGLIEAEPRFIQWRATLRTSDAQVTPTLVRVELVLELEARDTHATGDCDIADWDVAPIVRSSFHFADQPQTEPRLKLARERWGLEQVVAGARDELEELVRLCDWTRRQWKNGWNSGGELWYCPPWDGLVVRELAIPGLALGMCTHYSTVFVQACQAMGFIARHVIIQAHCVAEVWSNQHAKWVMFDPGCDTDDGVKGTYHLERGGVPLSALEAHRAWFEKDLNGLAMVPQLYKPRFELSTWLEHFARFCINLQEDNLTSLSAGEPEHGVGPYHFDKYLWWEDEHSPKLPWFTLSTSREADMYWSANLVAVHLAEGRKPGSLQVLFETTTPNFSHYEYRVGGHEPQETEVGELWWELSPGLNELSVCSVNQLGRRGPASSVSIEYKV